MCPHRGATLSLKNRGNEGRRAAGAREGRAAGPVAGAAGGAALAGAGTGSRRRVSARK